jgi:RNA polymerase sigma-70 factor (ECF subfamily)
LLLCRFVQLHHLVLEHEPALAGIARRLCRNDADADDLVQDTYEHALRALGRYRERGNLRGWMVRILNNLFVDRCRRSKSARTRPIESMEVPAAESSPPPAWTAIGDAQIARALSGLAPEFRHVYELHAAGKSYDEIADTLAIAKNTVGTRLLRARKKLKQRLEAQMNGEA